MKTLNSYLSTLSIFVCVLGTSCTNAPDGVIWGETDYYSDFLFKKYEPVIMNRTLELQFNDDARNLLSEHDQITFRLVEKDENGHDVAPTGIQLYKNGDLCKNNSFAVTIDENEVEVGLEFTKEVVEGYHNVYLRAESLAGLDRVDDTAIASGLVIRKNDVHNPLAVLLFWVAVFIVSVLILWLIFIKPMTYPTFSVGQLRLQDPVPYSVLCPLKHYRKVILTGRSTKQSFLNALFTGKIKYIVNPMWTSDVVFEPKDKNSCSGIHEKYSLFTSYMGRASRTIIGSCSLGISVISSPVTDFNDFL